MSTAAHAAWRVQPAWVSVLMSVEPDPGLLAPLFDGGIVRVDVVGLDVITPGVSVLAPRHALSASDGRIVLTETPALRRVVEIAGLQDLIDIAFTGSRPRAVGSPVGGPPGEPTRDVPMIEVRAELTIYADELHPGDVVDYSGVPHHVTRVDRGAGLAWPIASDGTGWAMALGHDVIVLHRT
jgi:hypothetical protein